MTNQNQNQNNFEKHDEPCSPNEQNHTCQQYINGDHFPHMPRIPKRRYLSEFPKDEHLALEDWLYKYLKVRPRLVP